MYLVSFRILKQLVCLGALFAYGCYAGGLRDAQRHFPEAVWLGFADGNCSGVKVGPVQYLTAAHCVIDARRGMPRPLREMVVSNAPAVSIQGAPRQRIRAIAVHPEVARACARGCPALPAYPDVALIILHNDAQNNIPIAVIETRPPEAGAAVIVGGYGKELYARGDCVRAGRPPAYSYERKRISSVGSSFFDSPFYEDGGYLCGGDSGGPVFLDDVAGTRRVVGINSYGTIPEGMGRHARLDLESGTPPVGQWLREMLR